MTRPWKLLLAGFVAALLLGPGWIAGQDLPPEPHETPPPTAGGPKETVPRYGLVQEPARAEDEAAQGGPVNDAPPAEPPAEESEPAAPRQENGLAEEPERVEVIRTRYPNRNIKIERHVTQDDERNYVNHGLWTMWDPDGTVVAKGQFRWGKRQGRWYRLHTDDTKNLVAGKLARYFDPPFASEADFVDDKLHGAWRIFDAHNREVKTYEFDHGRLHGVAVQWYPNGQKQRETHYVDGAMTGELKEWDTNGRETRSIGFTDGRTTIPYVKKYSSGELQIQGQYLSAKRIYKTTIDFWHGVVKVEVARREGTEKRHGKWVHYYKDGGVQFKGEFVDDRPVGRHTWWFANGQKRIDGEFVEGKEEGQWRWWHPNGQKHLEGKFANGGQLGTWVRWKSDGKVEEVQEHNLKSPGRSPGPRTMIGEGGTSSNGRLRSLDKRNSPSLRRPSNRPARNVKRPSSGPRRF